MMQLKLQLRNPGLKIRSNRFSEVYRYLQEGTFLTLDASFIDSSFSNLLIFRGVLHLSELGTNYRTVRKRCATFALLIQAHN